MCRGGYLKKKIILEQHLAYLFMNEYSLLIIY